MRNVFLVKKVAKIWATSVIFQKTLQSCPILENSPNLVTLLQRKSLNKIELFAVEQVLLECLAAMLGF
jgi:hypothetical protein